MKKPNIERLQKLYNWLGTVPKKHFNLDSFSEVDIDNIDEKEAVKLLTDAAVLRKSPCGTTACALGWAALEPSFKAAGLKFATPRNDPARNFHDTVYGTVVAASVLATGKKAVTSKTPANFNAGAEFFGIDLKTSFYLFDPKNYGKDKSTTAVRRHIKNVINNGGKVKDSIADNIYVW